LIIFTIVTLIIAILFLAQVYPFSSLVGVYIVFMNGNLIIFDIFGSGLDWAERTDYAMTAQWLFWSIWDWIYLALSMYFPLLSPRLLFIISLFSL